MKVIWTLCSETIDLVFSGKYYRSKYVLNNLMWLRKRKSKTLGKKSKV